MPKQKKPILSINGTKSEYDIKAPCPLTQAYISINYHANCKNSWAATTM